jgi:Hemolysins and related proteins containing CBS domains
MEATLPSAPVSPTTGLVLLALCLLGIAFFSSSEAAIISVNKIRLRHLAEKGSAGAKALQRLFQDHDRLFATILLLEIFLIIAASSIGSWMAMQAFEASLAPIPLAVLTVLGVTALVVLFGQLIPKTFAAQTSESYALAVAPPLELIVAVVRPVVWGFTAITSLLLGSLNRLLRRDVAQATPFLTQDEIRMLVDVGQEEGVLEQEESQMIRSIIELGDTTVREIMVPRIDIVALPEDATFDEAVKVAIHQGHSRIPIYRESSDNIIGVLYVKDLLAFLQADERPHQLPTAYVRPAYYIPESKPVDALLEEMRRAKIHVAIVMDEYGGTAGLVTIEDILEEIVGDIQDEYDAEEQLAIQHQEDGSVLVDGMVPIDEVNELLDAELPTEDFDTLGGFVVGLLGRAPNPGEEVTFGKLRLIAHEVEHRRLVRVQIFRLGTGPLVEGPDTEPEPHARED